MASRVHRKRRPLLPSGSLFLLAAAVWYLGHSFWPHRTPARLDAYTQLSLHGRVTKHGPVVGLAQLSALFTGIDNPDPNMASALYYPGDWRQQRLAGKRPPPPGRLCAIMWNDALKVISPASGIRCSHRVPYPRQQVACLAVLQVIFVKNVKAAGSTLVTYFKDCAVMGPNDGPFEWRCLRTLNFGNVGGVWAHATTALHPVDAVGGLLHTHAGTYAACLARRWDALAGPSIQPTSQPAHDGLLFPSLLPLPAGHASGAPHACVGRLFRLLLWQERAGAQPEPVPLPGPFHAAVVHARLGRLLPRPICAGGQRRNARLPPVCWHCCWAVRMGSCLPASPS